MTMCMYKNKTIPFVAITNRHLVEGDYLEQIKKVAKQHPESIVVREKDLPESEYKNLAQKVITIGQEYDVPVFLHAYVGVAKELDVANIQVPFFVLQKMTGEEKRAFQQIGASIHSVKEAQEAQRLGATRLIAGHIFETACKKGLPPRGLDFLEKVCEAVDIPVYAIGGITYENAKKCIKAGAEGVCMMSEFMRQ